MGLFIILTILLIEIIVLCQQRAIRVIFKKPPNFSCRTIFSSQKILTFPSIHILHCLVFAHNNKNILSTQSHNYSTRHKHKFVVPPHSTTFFKKHLTYNSISFYNSLPEYIKQENSIKTFKRRVKDFLVEKCCYSVRDYFT